MTFFLSLLIFALGQRVSIFVYAYDLGSCSKFGFIAGNILMYFSYLGIFAQIDFFSHKLLKNYESKQLNNPIFA